MRATYAGAYTLAYRLTGNEEDARDAVQDAYLRAYRALRRFRGDSQFTTWLYRITANCSATLLAKRNRHRSDRLSPDDDVADTDPASDPEASAAGTDERARISAALSRLPGRLRQVIVLRDVYDLPHGAIADHLGITEAAAKVRLHRARRRLRDILASEPWVRRHGLAQPAGDNPDAASAEADPDTATDTAAGGRRLSEAG